MGLDWRLQIVKRAIVARIPFGNALRRLKRRVMGYEPDPKNIDYTIANFEQMGEALAAEGRSFTGATVLEIGSGWFPVIPILLAQHDVRHVFMTDLIPHMDETTFAATLRYMKGARPDTGFLAAVNRFDDLPATYLAPFDPALVTDGSLDYVLSRTVLEHIEPDDIVAVLSAMRPKLKPGGLMIHFIDNSDHLEFGDKSISRIHFLTLSEQRHALINRLIRDGENRLRHHEYPALFERAGFRVVSASGFVHEPTKSSASTLRLTAPFSDMRPEDLATLTSIYVLAGK